MNVDGISEHKYTDLLVFSATADYDIIAIAETWLNDDVNNLESMNIKYNVFRRDRSASTISATLGGGVLIAVKNEIQCEEFKCAVLDPLEAICVKITLPTGCVYIYCLYIQPTADIEIYRSHATAIETVKNMINKTDIFQIFGDFNFKGVDWLDNDDGFDYIPVIGDSMSARSSIAREITTKLTEFGLFQMSSFPNVSGNVLDLVYTTFPELSVVSKADFLMLP
jgi:hypothetical protein